MSPITQLRIWHYNRIADKPRVLKHWGRVTFMWEYGLGDKRFSIYPTKTSDIEFDVCVALYDYALDTAFPIIGENRFRLDRTKNFSPGWESHYLPMILRGRTWHYKNFSYWHTSWKKLKEERADEDRTRR